MGKLNNKPRNKKLKEVKRMAVMTQSENSAFVVEADKIDSFIQYKNKKSECMDYSIIIKQSKQIYTQIKNKVAHSDEK